MMYIDENSLMIPGVYFTETENLTDHAHIKEMIDKFNVIHTYDNNIKPLVNEVMNKAYIWVIVKRVENPTFDLFMKSSDALNDQYDKLSPTEKKVVKSAISFAIKAAVKVLIL